MQHSNHARAQVIGASVRVDRDARLVEGDGDRVDGEVASREIGLDLAGGLDVRQGPGRRVGFRSRGGDVDSAVRSDDRGGGEALVAVGVAAERLGELDWIADGDQIEIERLGTDEDVAHRSANQVGARPRACGSRPYIREAGQRLDPRCEVVEIDVA